MLITKKLLFLTLLFFLFFNILSFSQPTQRKETGAFSGFVYDKSTGEALVGANLIIKSLKKGISTNVNGYFILMNIPNGDYILSVSLIGYSSKDIKITVKGTNETMKIYLDPEDIRGKEVVVTSTPTKTSEVLYKKPISLVEITPQEINRIPQFVESDLLRTLQTIPGITTLSDFSSALYIRGGLPDENLFLLDGTDVYNPEHFFGVFSTFNTDAIKHVDLSKGGFGAQYGGRLSSVLSVTNLDGNRNRFEGTASVSLLSAKTTLQMPLSSIGSISGSFRRTYFDQTIAKFLIDEIPNYYFYDGNLKAFLDLSENDKLTVSFFGGNDNLNYVFDEKDSDSPSILIRWGNITANVNYKRILSHNIFSSFWISYSRFSSNFSVNIIDIAEKNYINDFTLKGVLEYFYSDELDFNFGFEAKNISTSYENEVATGLINIQRKNNHISAYTTVNYKPNILWNISVGLRADLFLGNENYQNIDPRLAVKYRLTEDINLKAAFGIYHQYLQRINRNIFASIWTAADKNLAGSRAYHYIVGVQKEIAQDYSLEVEGYYKNYNNIYMFDDYFETRITPTGFNEDNRPVYINADDFYLHGDGISYGLEIMFKKDVGIITGWVGTSLSRVEHVFERINKGQFFVPRQDRTFVLNMVANCSLNDLITDFKGVKRKDFMSNWNIGANFVYATGRPITVPSSIYFMNPGKQYGRGGYYEIKIDPTVINTYRLPAYARLDISITWERRYETWTLSPFLQIFNVGNRGNVWFISYDDKVEGSKTTKIPVAETMLPLLPSIGVNIKF
jgi:hypothetical protein